MPRGIIAGDLVNKAVAGRGAELVKSGAKTIANNKAVDKAFQKGFDKAAEAAIGAVFAFATGGAAAAYSRKRDKREARRDATDLARQVGGTFSLNVMIGSERYNVVWLADKTPYRVIPELPKDAGPLEELPDLKHFRGVRHEPKPQKS
jgi:hypothetical protein